MGIPGIEGVAAPIRDRPVRAAPSWPAPTALGTACSPSASSRAQLEDGSLRCRSRSCFGNRGSGARRLGCSGHTSSSVRRGSHATHQSCALLKELQCPRRWRAREIAVVQYRQSQQPEPCNGPGRCGSYARSHATARSTGCASSIWTKRDHLGNRSGGKRGWAGPNKRLSHP